MSERLFEKPLRAGIKILTAGTFAVACSGSDSDSYNFNPALETNFVVGDCERNPSSWATDAGGPIRFDKPMDSSLTIGLVESYDEQGKPVLEDGARVDRSADGRLLVLPLMGEGVLIDDSLTLEETMSFETAQGNLISIVPKDQTSLGVIPEVRIDCQ